MSSPLPVAQTTTVAERLCSELVTRRSSALDKSQRSDPQSNPRASNIHDCARNIVYQVLDWEKKTSYDRWMLARFEEGKRQEKAIVDEIRSDGFEVIDVDENGQLTIAVPETTTKEFRRGEVCTGRLDGLIKWEDVWLPLEVKSINPNVFNGINSVDDLKKHHLYRKWPRQLLLYMYGRNKEHGLFVLSDCLGHRKYFPLTLDFGDAEWIISHLEKAARHIRARTYPDRIPYDSHLCGKCQFAATCLPDVIAKEAELIDNEELEAEIAQHEELSEKASLYEKIHKKLKATFKGVEKLIVGDRFLVQNAPSQRTVYELPPEVEAEIAEIKKGYAKKMPVEVLSIVDLEKKTTSEEAS